MKFEEVLPALREGKKITNNYLKLSEYKYLYYKYEIIFNSQGGYWNLTRNEIINCDDWEIVKETKKIKLRDLTKEQYEKWVDNNCLEYNNYCDKCPFQKVKCEKDGGQNSLWINNKDLYSDKFLDQEIEVEE